MIKNKWLFLIIFILFAIGFYLFLNKFFIKREKVSTISPKTTFQNLSVFKKEIPPLSDTDFIFKKNHEWAATLSADYKIVLLASGDVIPARSVNFQSTVRKNFLWPYEKVSEVMKNGDINLINLETPIFEGCEITQEGMKFCGDGRQIEGLTTMGTDVVNMANNHAGNYGMDGVLKTRKLLENNGIAISGNGGAIFKEIKGMKFAFLGYNDIEKGQEFINQADMNVIIKDLKEVREKAYVVVVSFHFGTEYQPIPNERQKELAHGAIDNGADLIIGNHPHWIQGVEIYKGKFITYAHGNFIFDQMWSEETKTGVVGKYTFYDKHLVDVEFLPIYISGYGQTEFLSGEKKNLVLKTMSERTKMIKENK